MAQKPSYPRGEALQPARRKARLARNGSEALGDKEIERDPQEGIENDSQRGEGASETAWDLLSPSYDSSIHLGSSPPDSDSIIGLARGIT